jgi:hypothetical protein
MRGMGIALASVAEFTAAVRGAHEISLTSYTLHPGTVLGTLDAAAQRGAAVHVRLDGDPRGGRLTRDNAAAVAELRAAGADAKLTDKADPVMHMKAAIVDGVAWLDDRNWAGTDNERVVRVDDPRDVATTKADALRREADVIEHAGSGELDVESESFGNGSIYRALLQRAKAHLSTRLIVAGREVAETRNAPERGCLRQLAALGVEIRAGDARHHDLNEKLAVAADRAWVGSANATYDGGRFGEQADWGIASGDRGVVDGLRAAFAANWQHALPLGN